MKIDTVVCDRCKREIPLVTERCAAKFWKNDIGGSKDFDLCKLCYKRILEAVISKMQRRATNVKRRVVK